MPIDLLIRGGTLVMSEGERVADLAIDGGHIVGIEAEAAREELDANGLHVFPGVVDPHVHFNEPGRTDWEGWATGSAALAAGGGTLCFDMPLNSTPPVLDGETFDAKVAAATASSVTDFALWGGLTPDNLDKLEELAERGVVGFKAFMSGSGIDDFRAADDATLWRGMEVAAELALPVAVHAENHDLTAMLAERARAEGRVGVRDYLASRPVAAEVEAIRRAITFAGATGCKLHIVHISSPAGVDAANQLRGEADVSLETCPHYLTLCDDDVEVVGAPAKCAPPLRTEDERAELVRHVRRREIDMIGSDHSPAPNAMKLDPNFFNVWGGIAGVQSTLPALLAVEPALSLVHVAVLTAANAAGRFRIAGKGSIAVGNDADIAVVDVAARYELTRDMLLDRHKLSPYIGRAFSGRVRRTIVRGHTVFADGRLAANDFRGKLVKPEAA